MPHPCFQKGICSAPAKRIQRQRHFKIKKMEVCLSGCVFSSLVYELENSRGDVVRFNLWEFLLFDLLILTILSPVVSGRIVVGSDIKTYSKHHYRFSVWKFAAWAGCKWVFKIAVISLDLKSWRSSLRWCFVFIFIAIQGFVPLDKSRRYVYIILLSFFKRFDLSCPGSNFIEIFSIDFI